MQAGALPDAFFINSAPTPFTFELLKTAYEVSGAALKVFVATEDWSAKVAADGAVNVYTLQLQCAEQIPVNSKGHTFVIDPCFLYEKLLDALTSLSPEQNIDNAVRLFGWLPMTPLNLSPQLDHGELNKSQQRAIALCCQKEPNLDVGSARYGQNPDPWRPVSRIIASRQTHTRHTNH